jgi:methylated-DNA-protein-cysteine methyltransferase related protein
MAKKPENPTTIFTREVVRLTKKIPKGKVATYGQIAALAGNPRGARGVGWILHSLARSRGLPWQRVINRLGQISFPEDSRDHAIQRRRLEAEGVRFDRKGVVNLAEYRWRPAPAKKQKT